MNNNSLPQLTACLLTYNHSHLLSEIIQHILEQTYSDFDLIISDDCSTDNSFEVAKAFEKIDKRVNVIRTPRNLGMAGNANYAISQVKDEYVALLHHDDILNKNTFEDWVECMRSDKNIAFVFNDYCTMETQSSNYYLKNKLNYVNDGKLFLKNILLKQWGCPVRGTALIRKKYYDEIGGMDEKFGMLADVDLWMRLAARWDVGYVNKPLMEVLVIRPLDYPKDYTEFSWKRLFILFDIHSSNINRNNYPNYIGYIFKRFVFRNKVSFEIIKWHLYALIKRKKEIIKSYPSQCSYELFYSKIIHLLMKAVT